MAEFRSLTALDELRQPLLERELSAKLIAYGLPADDADAVAHNTVLLYFALNWNKNSNNVFELLSVYSLGEIAELCENYHDWCAGTFESAINTSYKEEML